MSRKQTARERRPLHIIFIFFVSVASVLSPFCSNLCGATHFHFNLPSTSCSGITFLLLCFAVLSIISDHSAELIVTETALKLFTHWLRARPFVHKACCFICKVHELKTSHVPFACFNGLLWNFVSEIYGRSCQKYYKTSVLFLLDY